MRTAAAIALGLILAGVAGCDPAAEVESGMTPPGASAPPSIDDPIAATVPDEAAADSPRGWIEAYLAGREQPDDVFAQARAADAFEYRPVLARAIDGDEARLRELLLYTGRATLKGAASEDHAALLVALLEVWRDEPFAAVLSTTPPEAVSATQRLLLSGGAERERFPATFAVPAGPAKR